MKAKKRAFEKVGWSAVLAASAVFLSLITPATAQNADCERLRRAIADASHAGQGAQFQAAADRQRAEIDRTVSYARELGCDKQKFLFFGSDPPAQCGQIKGQIGRMRANLDDLQARAGGGAGGRGELIARFNSQCGNQQGKSQGLVEALFGQPKPGDVEEQPLTPDGTVPQEKSTAPIGEARAGGKAVCVRTCDGAFFPVSYSAGATRLDQLADLCRALCPNAEVTLYTYPVSGEIEQALSINGARYMDSPTALRYRKTFDPSCSCRRRGQTWASALAPAETLLGQEDKSDIIVTPEKAAELSLPKPDSKPNPPKPKNDPKSDLKNGKTAKATPTPSPSPTPSAVGDGGKTDANGVDMTLRDAAATISRDSSGIAGAAENAKSGPVAENQGKTFDETTPDGVKRTVRVIGN